MKDEFGTYRTAFYFAGASMLVSSLVINCSSLCSSDKRLSASEEMHRKTQNKETAVPNGDVSKTTSVSVTISSCDFSPNPTVSTNPGAYKNLAYADNDIDERKYKSECYFNTRL